MKLEEVLGAQVAATVMEHLPPVGWADVATKRDLDIFQVAMAHDLDELRVATKRDLEHLEISIRAELRGEINRLLLWLFPTLVTLLGLTFAAAKLS